LALGLGTFPDPTQHSSHHLVVAELHQQHRDQRSGAPPIEKAFSRVLSRVRPSVSGTSSQAQLRARLRHSSQCGRAKLSTMNDILSDGFRIFGSH
jgi:hypothetical protein